MKRNGKRELLALSDGTTIHFTSRYVAQRYFRKWCEDNGYSKGEVRHKYIREE